MDDFQKDIFFCVQELTKALESQQAVIDNLLERVKDLEKVVFTMGKIVTSNYEGKK